MNARRRGQRLHRTSNESYTARTRKKLTQRYRQRKDKVVKDMVEESRGKPRSRTTVMRQQDAKGREMKTRTVIFVEQTRDGALEGMIGFRVKVVESVL